MSDPRETALASWTAPDAAGWRRLDPRVSLLVGLRVLASSALPAVPAMLGLAGRIGYWSLLVLAGALAVACLFGVAHWLTAGYRITDQRLELRHGVLRRNLQNAPLDRIRSVDLTAPLLHRLLGVSKVAVGTGVDSSRVELGAVTHGEAARLRGALLRGDLRPAPAAGVPAGGPAEDPGDAPAPGDTPAPAADGRPDDVLAVLDWSWMRYAPLSLARLAVLAGAFGASTQFLPDLHIDETQAASSAWDWLSQQAVAALIVAGIVVALLGWVAIALVGFALQWGGLRLTRQHRGSRTSLHLQAGLLSTRAITIEERRIRGIVLVEPWLLRQAGAADLRTWATGVEDGVATVLPPCPRPTAVAVAGQVLGVEDDAALQVPLTDHGPVARRRAHLRGQWPTLALLTAAAVTAFVPDSGPAPVLALVAAGVAALIGAGCAEAAFTHLGHARVDGPRGGHLVVGNGILTRRRTVLEADGVIGWVLRQSYFQRRGGVATLVATTAAGPEQIAARDIPLPAALALMDSVSPVLVEAFGAPAQPRTASTRTSAMSSS